MKKLVLITIALVFAAISISAQEYGGFKKGYSANISTGLGISVSKTDPANFVSITTSHGYSFGDGMYVGGGIGLEPQINGHAARIPIYFESKYNIEKSTLSPFVDCRMGCNYIIGYDSIRYFLSPGVGFDYHRLSYRINYICETGGNFKKHAISFTTGINF